MSANTKIEWCHATVNYWDGCTAVSPACDNCYAKRMAGRLWGTEWGAGKPRHQFAGASDTLRALDRKAQRLGYPLRVFHNSLSDFFDNEVPAAWRISAMRDIVDTPNLIHLLLTKRIGNAANMLEQAFRAVHAQREGWADNVPPNVWIGATIVNQEEADRDILKLLAVPAAKRFLSMEPLLGSVNLTNVAPPTTEGHTWHGIDSITPANRELRGCIDWVIVGGESGPSARPMHTNWARSLRDQCKAAGVPFLFKQWGEWVNAYPKPSGTPGRFRLAPHDKDAWVSTRDMDVYPRQFIAFGSTILERIGKKAAGRLLDGREWNGVPA